MKKATKNTSNKGAPQFAIWRVRAVAYGLLAGFVVLAGRGLYLQVVQHDDLTKRGDARTMRDLVLPAHRGRLLDREGAVLASSVPARGVFAFPDQVELTTPQRDGLAKALNLRPKDLDRKLDTERDLVFLARGIAPEQGQAVTALKIPGVAVQTEYKREYPAQEVMGQVLGITNVDDVGQEGLELAQNEWLSGKPGARRVTIDRRGSVVEELGGIRSPQQGRDLQLALDSRLQHLAFRELKRGRPSRKRWRCGCSRRALRRNRRIGELPDRQARGPLCRSHWRVAKSRRGRSVRTRLNDEAVHDLYGH